MISTQQKHKYHDSLDYYLVRFQVTFRVLGASEHPRHNEGQERYGKALVSGPFTQRKLQYLVSVAYCES